MDEFLMGMALLIIVFMVIQLVRNYRIYRNSLYRNLYISYLEWFVRYRLKKDLSSSQKLESLSKYSRIMFHSIYDASRTFRYDFIIVAVPQGLSLYVLLQGVQEVKGKISDKKWFIKTTKNEGKIQNIYQIGLNHRDYIEKRLKDNTPVNLSLLVEDSCDTHLLDSKVPCTRASELYDSISQGKTMEYSDGALLDMIKKLEKETEDINV